MIILDNLSFSVNQLKIIQGFSYHFKPGYYHITGANGVGKTTLLKLMAGHLIPENKQQINYTTVEFPLLMLSETYFFEEISVLNNFKVYLPYYCQDRWLQLQNYFNRFFLTDLLNRKFKKLSAGEKKKCLIIHALLLWKSKICLLDEPFESLDTQSKETLHELIEDEVVTHQKCVIITTHINESKTITRATNILME
jgi:ABC-type multidrug transport system ATPase subunit